MRGVQRIDEYKFDAQNEIMHLTNWIKDYFVNNGDPKTKAIIGISGGKDSTIAAALLVRALGPDRVIGVLMPNGKQADLDDAKKVCQILNIRQYIINIDFTCNELYRAIDESIGWDITVADDKTISTNTPARVRMAVLYAIAAMRHGRVCNTGNRSELYVGYTTKYGDLAGDFALLKEYTVSEVLKLGEALTELPRELVFKTPSDGMSGLSDEDNLGFSYDQVDNLLLFGIVPEMEAFEKIKAAHRRNKHKECIHLPAPLKSDLYNGHWEF